MARSTRLNPTQQFQVSPTVDKKYTLVSDMADGGKYKHVPVSDIAGKATLISTETSSIVAGEVTDDSKTFTGVAVPPNGAGYTPTKVLADINGKFNVGTVESVTAGATPDTFNITVTGFSDESMAGDELGLLIVWNFPN